MQLITWISSYACVTTVILFFLSPLRAAGLSFHTEKEVPSGKATVPLGILPSSADVEPATVVHDRRNGKATKFFMPSTQEQAKIFPVNPQPPQVVGPAQHDVPPARRCNRPLLSKSGNSNGQAPMPCSIEPGSIVKLVDSKEQLIQDFGTNTPKVQGVATTFLTQNIPVGSTVLEVHSITGFTSGQSVAIDPGTDREEVARIASLASIHLQQPLRFSHPTGAEVKALPPQASTLCRYVPLMDSMVGKNYIVKDMRYGCVGLPAPDGTQGGVWYFPEKSLKMWEDTDDGQAPNVPMLAHHRSLGDSVQTRMDGVAVAPRSSDAKYDIEGWNSVKETAVKPTAPDFQEEAVDLDNPSNLPRSGKVRQIISVECLEAIHNDPTYVCDPDSYDRGAVGVQPPVQDVMHSKQSTDTDLFHPAGEGKRLKMETDFFRPSRETLARAQGIAEWEDR